MANLISKGTIGILTGGGDVPGLNPAIRAVTVRAMREGYKVIGLRKGWGGIIDMVQVHIASRSEVGGRSHNKDDLRHGANGSLHERGAGG